MTPLRDWGARGCAALAAATFLTLLASLVHIQPIPRLILAAIFALVPLSAFRPQAALLVLAGLTPFAAWIGRQSNGSVSWTETLVVAFCAGYCARRAILRRPATRDAVDSLDAAGTPWILAVAIVIASLAVHFLVEAWRFGGPPTRADLWKLVTFGYFISATSADPIDAAMRLLESLLLFRAALTVTRETPSFASRLASWAVCGASAAAGINLLRLWESAERFGSPWGRFLELFLTVRVNAHYGDLNAAGSYFVMALFVAIGLTMRRRGLPWLTSVVLIGSAVWVTGSRMAVISGMLAMMLPAGARVWRMGRGGVRLTTLAAATLILALLAVVTAVTIPERGNQRSAGTAAHVRWELGRTSLRMTAANPMFGVGIGRFYSRSGEFSSPELLESFPPAIHENAHNNFLQILAELGIVGFAVVMWLLWSAARAAHRLLRADLHDPLRWGLVTGLLAFVLSWLGGHPLLIDEPAFAFWMLLGTVAGWGTSNVLSRDGTAAAGVAAERVRLRGWVLPAALLVIALSVPVRADRQKADFNLEHRGVGLSTWRDAIDGVRYRLAGATSSVFLPADAQMVVVPLRAMGPVSELRTELHFDGRPADVVTVRSDRWLYLRLELPRDRNAPRFRRLDLHVTNGPPGDLDVLMIGKVEPK